MLKKVLLSSVLLTSFFAIPVQAMDEPDVDSKPRFSPQLFTPKMEIPAYVLQEAKGTTTTVGNYEITVTDLLLNRTQERSLIKITEDKQTYLAHQSQKDPFLYRVQMGNSVDLSVRFMPIPGEVNKLDIPGHKILEALRCTTESVSTPVEFNQKYGMNAIDLMQQATGQPSNIKVLADDTGKDATYKASQSPEDKFLYFIREDGDVAVNVRFPQPNEKSNVPGEAYKIDIPGHKIVEALRRQTTELENLVTFNNTYKMQSIDLLPTEIGQCSNVKEVDEVNETCADVLYSAVQSPQSKFLYFITGDSVHLSVKFERAPLEDEESEENVASQETVEEEDDGNVNVDAVEGIQAIMNPPSMDGVLFTPTSLAADER